MKFFQRLFLLVALVLTVGGAGLLADSVSADDGCVIPESGPWPPCATGGAPAAPPATADDCVIPESGPWPPCATGGGSAPAAPAPAGGDCVIPESGPWPPCATGGGSAPAAPAPSGDDCVIPESGPWPPCATGGGSPDVSAPAPPPAESAEKVRRFTLGELRAIVLATATDGTGSLEPDDCSVETIDQRLLYTSCLVDPCSPPFLPVCYLELYFSFGVSNGYPIVVIESFILAGQEADKSDESFQELQEDVQLRFVEVLSAELNYTEVISIELEDDAMVITYR